MQMRSWKLLDILNQTSSFFSSRGMENARLQAELLLADILGLRRLDLYLQFERQLIPAEVDAYREYVKQRLQNVPLQQITGEAAFRHLTFSVSKEVLIPRPETEILVEVALEYLADQTEPLVLDLGCGSGIIAVSIAHEHPTANLVAIDISEGALEVTRRNAERNGVGERLRVQLGDLFEPLHKDPGPEAFDAIVCNPPYVRSGEIAGLAPEVRDYEPHLALDGGEDGLDCYRRIAANAGDFLKAEGYLALEVGDSQAQAVGEILAERFKVVEVRPDLNDIPRVIVARPSSL